MTSLRSLGRKAVLVLALGSATLACTSDTVEPAASADAAALVADATAPGGADAGSGSPDLVAASLDVAGAEAPPPADAGGEPGCNLDGRWVVAQRILATALGQSQASHNWFYYEIKQDGAGLVVTKGLHCGFEVVKKTSLAASVDSMAAWPAFLARNTSTGRKGSITAEGGGCRLRLDREYVVRGATVAYYASPDNKLPTREQPASGTTPGWEDWDGDGNPGFSLKVTSTLASGTLYSCQRDWTVYDGIVSGSATKLKVAITYGAEQVALGRAPDSPQIIESTSAPATAPEEHFAWFHKLATGQAAGTDAEICAEIRTLARTQLPEAHQ